MLSQAEIKEWNICDIDSEYFIRKYCQENSDLYRHQIDILDNIDIDDRIAIIKKKHQGVSFIVGMYALWRSLFKKSSYNVIISPNDNISRYVLKSIQYTFANLPSFLQSNIHTTKHSIEFTTLQSKIECVGSVVVTENAINNQQLSTIIIDEADHMENLELMYQNIIPSLWPSGKLIVTTDNFCPKITRNFKIVDISNQPSIS